MDPICEISFTPNQAAGSDQQTRLAADQLGGLLFDTPEFQVYNRVLRAANNDEEVIDLTYQIRDQENNYCCSEGDQPDIDELYARLEGHPKIRELRQAERALRQLFVQVDALVSAAAHAPFTLYARAGCA